MPRQPSRKPARRSYHTYAIKTKRAGIHVGQSGNVKTRIAAHRSGRGARYTAEHGVRKVLGMRRFATREAAVREERRVKAMTPAQKRAWAKR